MTYITRLLSALLALALLLCGCGAPAPAGTLAPTPETEEPSVPGAELSVYCFSAGKADAFLLYTPQSAVLIDCGLKGFGKEILSYMETAGIERLDYLIISHFDKDHVGGAAKVLNNFPVGTVLQSNQPKDSEEYEKYVNALNNAGLEPVTVREPLSFTLDGVVYTVDPPLRETYRDKSSNNSSLIVTVQNAQNRFLFAGDAEDERTAEYLAQNPQSCDVLKLPHHGRWQSTLPELVERLHPAWAVITSSEEEPEDPETLDLLERAGVKTCLTREGPVLLRSDGMEITVEQTLESDMAA